MGVVSIAVIRPRAVTIPQLALARLRFVPQDNQPTKARRPKAAMTLGTIGVIVAGSLGFGVLARPVAAPELGLTGSPGSNLATPKAVQIAKKGDSQRAVHLETPAEVSALQMRLQELGYFIPTATSVYDDATEQAIWAFQKVAGLPIAEGVSEEMQIALEAGVRPQARTTEGKALEFDIDRQLLLAVVDGRVIRIFNASSANGDVYLTAQGRRFEATTPTGRFTVTNERDYVHQSSLGLGPMYRPKYFFQVLAIHGSEETPPYPSSHGCIRVSDAAMDWIWDVWGAPVGTTVWVY